MCDHEQSLETFPDEEPTKPMIPQTTAEIAAEWEAEFALPTSERPTRRFKKLNLPIP